MYRKWEGGNFSSFHHYMCPILRHGGHCWGCWQQCSCQDTCSRVCCVWRLSTSDGCYSSHICCYTPSTSGCFCLQEHSSCLDPLEVRRQDVWQWCWRRGTWRLGQQQTLWRVCQLLSQGWQLCTGANCSWTGTPGAGLQSVPVPPWPAHGPNLCGRYPPQGHRSVSPHCHCIVRKLSQIWVVQVRLQVRISSGHEVRKTEADCCCAGRHLTSRHWPRSKTLLEDQCCSALGRQAVLEEAPVCSARSGNAEWHHQKISTSLNNLQGHITKLGEQLLLLILLPWSHHLQQQQSVAPSPPPQQPPHSTTSTTAAASTTKIHLQTVSCLHVFNSVSFTPAICSCTYICQQCRQLVAEQQWATGQAEFTPSPAHIPSTFNPHLWWINLQPAGLLPTDSSAHLKVEINASVLFELW